MMMMGREWRGLGASSDFANKRPEHPFLQIRRVAYPLPVIHRLGMESVPRG